MRPARRPPSLTKKGQNVLVFLAGEVRTVFLSLMMNLDKKEGDREGLDLGFEVKRGDQKSKRTS